MMKPMQLMVVLLVFAAATAGAAERNGFSLAVETGDSARPEYAGKGKIYVEALRGRPYALRITNPMPYRVAVALSVDGLNTIDAKHTDSWSASKWVLDPYESTTISGWQVSGNTARKFFFTGETRSYGAALGQTKNLGVIEAVFYRERQPVAMYQTPHLEREQGAAASDSSRPRAEAQRSPAAPPSVKSAPAAALSDDYAATGMGRRERHEVTRVAMELEPTAVASIAIRYEFRPQLVKLGVLREPRIIERREHARGFESYCPETSAQD